MGRNQLPYVGFSLQIKVLICDQLNIHLNAAYFIYLEDKESVPKTPSHNVDEEGEAAGQWDLRDYIRVPW